MARLHAATPLTVVLVIALALLILSILSVPITGTIVLASNQSFKFGVFGYCNGDRCTPVVIGYDVAALDTNSGSFSLPSSARHSLSNILVVHVVAAGLTLICAVLAILSHVRGAAHSPRFLLALTILLLPTFILTLLSFLVDILMFVPHLSWGGWIVLAATVLIAIAGIITCTMRRTLVSQKAMRKRIAENAEMNGANYYARQAEERMAMDHRKQQDVVPQFAEFEVRRPEEEIERVPLNSMNNGQYPATSSHFAGTRDYGGNGFSEGATYAGTSSSSTNGRSRRGELPAMPMNPQDGMRQLDRPRGPRDLPPLTIPYRDDSRSPFQQPSQQSYGAAPPQYGPRRQPTPRQPPPGEEYSAAYPEPHIPSTEYPIAATQRKASGDSRDEDASIYSDYVAPRQAWRTEERQPTSDSLDRSVRSPRSEAYYEDADPRFSEVHVAPPVASSFRRQPPPPNQSQQMPQTQRYYAPPQPVALGRPDDTEAPLGSRSPAPSVSSHFTSVSQRGVNPRYQETGYYNPPRQNVANVRRQRQQDMILSGNPDFELPARGGGGRRRGPGASPGMF